MKLNGWIRLWIVLSIGSGVATLGTVLVSKPEMERPEDGAHYLSTVRKHVITVEIETIGEIEFPDTLSKERIQELVKSGMENIPLTVSKIAENEMQKAALIQAASARRASAEARSDWKQLCIILAGVWSAAVVTTFLTGVSVAWVRRGFAET